MYKPFLFGCGVQVEQVCCLSKLSAKPTSFLNEAACEYFCFQGAAGERRRFPLATGFFYKIN